PGGVVTHAGTWTSGAESGDYPDQTQVLFTESTGAPLSLEEFGANVLLGMTQGSDSSELVQEETFTTDLGVPAYSMVILTSIENFEFTSYVYTLGGGNTFINVSCTEFD